jgi:DinB superfamily
MSTAEQELERQQYPVGRFTLPQQVTAEQRRKAIEMLEAFPRLFRQEVEQRGDAGLELPYRPEGWTLRQLAHHVADSHSQMSGRLRMALTEDWPTIKPYDQEAWANLADASTMAVASSLGILDGVHARMVTLLRSLKEADWARGFHHPENGPERVDQVLLRYEWHSRHHLEHARAVPR